jgi:hypothetical protein
VIIAFTIPLTLAFDVPLTVGVCESESRGQPPMALRIAAVAMGVMLAVSQIGLSMTICVFERRLNLLIGVGETRFWSEMLIAIPLLAVLAVVLGAIAWLLHHRGINNYALNFALLLVGVAFTITQGWVAGFSASKAQEPPGDAPAWEYATPEALFAALWPSCLEPENVTEICDEIESGFFKVAVTPPALISTFAAEGLVVPLLLITTLCSG